MKARADNPSPEFLRSILEYNPDTGFLIWKVDPAFKKLKGSRAGCIDKLGYRVVRLFRRGFKESRVIWAMQTGKWPAHCIDHINNRRDDNRWGNLREATSAENRRNTPPKYEGMKGVSASHRKYRARIKIKGETLHLGTFESAAAAAKAYWTAADNFYGEFARA